MNYKSLSILILLLIGVSESFGMESTGHAEDQRTVVSPSESRDEARKRIIGQLSRMAVSDDRIENHKKRLQNWQSRRESVQNIALLAAATGAAYTLFKVSKPWFTKEDATAKADSKEKVELEKSITALSDQIKALRAEVPRLNLPDPEAPKGWFAGKINASCSYLSKGIPSLAKMVLASVVADRLSKVVLRSPLSVKILEGGDYLMRPRTLCWLLEKECKFGLALETINKLLMLSGRILDGDATYIPTMVNALMFLVMETEKILAHMEYVKDQLGSEYEDQKNISLQGIAAIKSEVTNIIASVNRFVDGTRAISNQDQFAEVIFGLIQGVQGPLKTILINMNVFGMVETAAGLIDFSIEGNPLDAEIKRLTTILEPQEVVQEDESGPSLETAVAGLIHHGTNAMLS